MAPRLSCREFVEFLAEYLSGELGPERLAAFNAHLAQCPSCVSYTRTYAEAIRLGKLASGSDESTPPDVPPELVQAILAARKAGP